MDSSIYRQIGTCITMKALILVGGFGTRLRPLTLSIPKPLVEFANKPMILHQIEALKAVGVTEVVLAINYQPEVMLNFLKEFEAKLGITISCSQETELLGQLVLLLWLGISSLMVPVDEPSKCGVVVMEETTGKVDKFVEKPKLFVGNKINAGIYLLNPSVLDRIELRPTSIEKAIFPKIAAEKKLYAIVLPGFWMDIGQPKDYIAGLRLYLDSPRKKSSTKLASGHHIVGNVLVHESAKIGEGCLIGPDVVVGPGCVVEAGVRLSRCTVMRGVRIKKHACISSSIIGWHSTVGQWARVENMTVLGEDVHVWDEIYSSGGVILPHKEIKSSILKPEIVIWKLGAWVHAKDRTYGQPSTGAVGVFKMICEGWVMEVRHIFREGNHYADHLANLAHEGTNGLVRLPNPPDGLLPSLHADALRHGKLRF
ncbi:hypothetical protein Gorai_004312 [Gossypium raimondii]|uniref:Nucleotidyl transferase domain-containing protein n=1 Tax=Gossypium raimondii TaxID=29730 RepID=A0A7J8QHU9_GOSRA|nr:hypothetical protein [Gossypium raimondii]